MRRSAYTAAVFAAVVIFSVIVPRANAQQAGGIVFELPEIRNYVAAAIGVVPDYMGSDDYTIGGAPAGCPLPRAGRRRGCSPKTLKSGLGRRPSVLKPPRS